MTMVLDKALAAIGILVLALFSTRDLKLGQILISDRTDSALLFLTHHIARLPLSVPASQKFTTCTSFSWKLVREFFVSPLDLFKNSSGACPFVRGMLCEGVLFFHFEVF